MPCSKRHMHSLPSSLAPSLSPPSPNSPFLIACFFTQVYDEVHGQGDRQEPLEWINQMENAALLSIFLIEMQFPPPSPFVICFSDVLTCRVPKSKLFLFSQAMVAAKNFFIAGNAGL